MTTQTLARPVSRIDFLALDAGRSGRPAAVPTLKQLGVNGLFADALDNPKVAKNADKLGVMTAPMHLAPARVSGFNTCGQASPGCAAACLHSAGNPTAMQGKTRARIARTRAFFVNRPAFMARAVREIELHVRRCERANMECAVRMNATSDIPWEVVPCVRDGVRYANVMQAFPGVQFYDYTKITKRALAAAAGGAEWPSNYHLTFSLSENNEQDAARVLAAGGNVAVVFGVRARYSSGRKAPGGYGRALPEMYALWGLSAPVIDGDEHDYRPADPAGVIVGLRAKGDAIGSDTGFVRAV